MVHSQHRLQKILKPQCRKIELVTFFVVKMAKIEWREEECCDFDIFLALPGFCSETLTGLVLSMIHRPVTASQRRS